MAAERAGHVPLGSLRAHLHRRVTVMAAHDVDEVLAAGDLRLRLPAVASGVGAAGACGSAGLRLKEQPVRRIAAAMMAVVHTIFVNLIVPISMYDETAADGRRTLSFAGRFLRILKRILSSYNRPVSSEQMLDKSLTEFLEQGLAIHIGTRNARCSPTAAASRRSGSRTGPHTWLPILPKAATPAVLDDLRSNGQAARVVRAARPTIAPCRSKASSFRRGTPIRPRRRSCSASGARF